MNSHISGMRSNESIRLRWMWHTVTEFRRVSVIVVRSHVLSLRRALKLRSASADEAGETSRSRTRMQTVSNNPRTSGSICRNSVTASPTTSILLRSCLCETSSTLISNHWYWSLGRFQAIPRHCHQCGPLWECSPALNISWVRHSSQNGLRA